jgi:hypothetical protein
MRVNTRRRLHLARLKAVLVAASALAVPLVATPAGAAPSGESAPTASRAASTAGVADGPIVELENARTRNCLASPDTPRSAALQADCIFDFPPNPPIHQFLWRSQSVGGRNFVFTNRSGFNCLQSNSPSSDGDAVFVNDCRGDSSQTFTLIPDPQGRRPIAYEIVNIQNGKCVVPGGASGSSKWIIQWTCNPNDTTFLWHVVIEPASGL